MKSYIFKQKKVYTVDNKLFMVYYVLDNMNNLKGIVNLY